MLLATPDWFKWFNAYSGALLLVVAVVTGVFVFLQVREAARLRREQAQPYVAVDMRQVGTGPTNVHAIELVIKNFGSTAAHNIRLESIPPLTSNHQFASDIEFETFEVLPTLVPGQEWSTLWEGDAATRIASDLPQFHDVTVRCEDSRGRKMDPATFRLDWTAHKFRVFRVINGLHEIHAELQKVRKDLDEIKNGQSRLKVLTQDEVGYMSRLEAEYAEFRRLAEGQQEEPLKPEQREEE